MYLIIPGDVKGIDSLWIIGDEFCHRTFAMQFKLRKNNSLNSDDNTNSKSNNQRKPFIFESYEVEEFSASRYSSSVRSVLARCKALLAKAIHQEKVLPKVIVFVHDDDIIKQTNISKEEAKDGEFTIIVKYLLEEINRLVNDYAEKLPHKSKRQFHPHMLWILPPSHKYLANNVLCECYNQSLEEEVKAYPAMCALRLKKVWNETDG